jgi:GxxExxY protein
MSNSLPHSELTEQVIGAAYEVYNELGFGFLETVYEKSLLIALRDRGVDAIAQKPIDVWFRGEVVGNYVADLVVGDSVLVELKSVRTLIEAHEVQLVNYLVATGTPVGLLINFGPDNVDVKRKVKRLPT